MNQEEIVKVLAAHASWLAGTGGERANLRCADLRYADLRGAYLRGADLRDADLRDADLRGADLRGADLRGAYLHGANLRGADLRGADLRGAYLHGADLRGAYLRGADLRGAYLRGADLRGADLRGADLARLLRCPETGEFEAWKKLCGGVLAKLKIPAHAKRSSSTGYKCRASEVVVLELVGAEVGESMYHVKATYRVGETVVCDQWCEDRWIECGGGIHFYMTRAEAEDHV